MTRFQMLFTMTFAFYGLQSLFIANMVMMHQSMNIYIKKPANLDVFLHFAQTVLNPNFRGCYKTKQLYEGH